MSEFLDLANDIENMPIQDDVVEVMGLTPKQRNMIVAALRGADALRSLAELPPLGDSRRRPRS
jgi:hypothetical protein